MAIVKTSAKGQVVIPADIRRRAGLHAGDRVSVDEHEGIIVITPVARDPVAALTGILKGRGSYLQALMKSREEERRREEEEAARHLRDSGLASE